MDKDRLQQRLMMTFVAELDEHVRSLEQNFLALEQRPDRAAAAKMIESLLRTLHSLKGAARSVQIPLLEMASHRMEEVMTFARDERIAKNEDFFHAMLEATDAIGEVGRRLRASESLTDAPLAAITQRLPELLTGRPLKQRPAPPRAAGLGGANPNAAKPPFAASPASVPMPRPIPVSAATTAAPGPIPVPKEPAARTSESAAGPTTASIRSAPAEAPQTASAPAAAAPVEARQSGRTMRVASEKLDDMLRQCGELLTIKHRADLRGEEGARIQEIAADCHHEWREVERTLSAFLDQTVPGGVSATATETSSKARLALDQAVNRSRDSLWRLERGLQRLNVDLALDRKTIERTAAPLDATIRQARMFPFAEICEGLNRMVRDLCKTGGKEAELTVVGGDIEVDRFVLDGLRSPLVHLIRNAVDHGIEAPDRRGLAGKPVAGRIQISAAIRGSRIEVIVSDDGAGLDVEAIRTRLVRAGRPVPNIESELLRTIFESGFSTSAKVTDVSGRGVGLDVVENELSAIRGTVDVDFEPGHGTRFTLSVPLTLSSIRALLIEAGGRIYALDTASVSRVIRIGAADIVAAGEREMLIHAGTPVQLLALADVLGLPDRTMGETDRRPVIILSANGRQIGLVAESILAEREIVIQSLGARLAHCAYIGGATILPDGKVSLILSADDLVERGAAHSRPAMVGEAAGAAGGAGRRRLLIADDSATIRMLEKSILEAAGYDVVVATDGQDAWNLLLEMGADLVVSDVEMPRMDGFSLTEAIRGSARFRDLPVILVTGLESDADKARGMAVGANAYRPKSAFDQQDLLATIERML